MKPGEHFETLRSAASPGPCAAVVFRFGAWAPLSRITLVGAEGLEPPTCWL